MQRIWPLRTANGLPWVAMATIVREVGENVGERERSGGRPAATIAEGTHGAGLPETSGGGFDELHAPHAEAIARLCRRMLDSAEDAEEAAQEVFVKARTGFASYDPARPLRTWLLRVAAHHCIDRLRRRHSERKLFEPSELQEEGLPDRGPSPLRSYLARERSDLLMTALDAMPARFRAVLAMRYFAELSYAEIAEAAEISTDQVGVLLFRGKARLREALGGKGER